MDQRSEMLVKHLEMIQNTIVRMASNSFMLKGWSIIIISAVLALDASNLASSFIYIAYLPALSFWVLDAYFLSQERYFRRLYDKVRGELTSPDQSSSIEPFSMNAPKFAKAGDHWLPTIWSPTLLIFHGTVVVLVTIVMLFLE